MPISDALAVLNTPEVTPNVTVIRLNTVNISRPTTTATILVDYVDAAENSRRTETIVLSAVPDIVALITAIGTPRLGETGAAVRRFNYRVLGHLSDSGYLPGVTVSA